MITKRRTSELRNDVWVLVRGAATGVVKRLVLQRGRGAPDANDAAGTAKVTAVVHEVAVVEVVVHHEVLGALGNPA